MSNETKRSYAETWHGLGFAVVGGLLTAFALKVFGFLEKELRDDQIPNVVEELIENKNFKKLIKYPHTHDQHAPKEHSHNYAPMDHLHDKELLTVSGEIETHCETGSYIIPLNYPGNVIPTKFGRAGILQVSLDRISNGEWMASALVSDIGNPNSVSSLSAISEQEYKSGKIQAELLMRRIADDQPRVSGAWFEGNGLTAEVNISRLEGCVGSNKLRYAIHWLPLIQK